VIALTKFGEEQAVSQATTVSATVPQPHYGSTTAESAHAAAKPKQVPVEQIPPQENLVAKQQIAAIYAEAQAGHWSQAHLTQALSEADAEYGSSTSLLDLSA
jgi:hypothetical protein